MAPVDRGFAHVRETAVKPATELVRLELLLGAAPAGNHHSGRGHSRQPRDTDQFPGHPHRRVAYRS